MLNKKGNFLILLTFVFLSHVGRCEEVILSDFENKEEWTVQYNGKKINLSILSLSPDAIHGKNSFLITSPPVKGAGEIEITKEINKDLSNFERIEFWVKGFSNGKSFYFLVEDAEGRAKEYYFVPDSLLYDIFTPEWRRITIKIEPCIIEWKKVRRIGFKIVSKRGANSITKIKIDTLIAG
ncbi:hypothetical protein J7L87_06165, partial [bacterium]|nr:hypothetical protein [bacterium]